MYFFPMLAVRLLDFRSLRCLRPPQSACRVSLQCPAAQCPCSAQPHSIPAVPMPTYPCSETRSISAVLNGKVSLSCPALAMPNPAAFAKLQYCCRAFAVLQGRQFRGDREALRCLCSSGFRVGMLEVNNLHFPFGYTFLSPKPSILLSILHIWYFELLKIDIY